MEPLELLDKIRDAYQMDPYHPDPAQRPPGSDREAVGRVLLHHVDDPELAGAGLTGRDYYSWLWAAGYAARPRAVVDLGTRRGYALAALAEGARAAAPRGRLTLRGYDSDARSPGGVDRATAALRAVFPDADAACVRLDLDNPEDLAIADAPAADVVHCGRGGSYDATTNDLRWAQSLVRPGGIILVDAYALSGDVRRAVGEARARGTAVLPTRQGLAVLLV